MARRGSELLRGLRSLQSDSGTPPSLGRSRSVRAAHQNVQMHSDSHGCGPKATSRQMGKSAFLYERETFFEDCSSLCPVWKCRRPEKVETACSIRFPGLESGRMEFGLFLESPQELNLFREHFLLGMANAWNVLLKVSLFGDFYKENNLTILGG